MTIEERDVLALLCKVPRQAYPAKQIVGFLPQHKEEDIMTALESLITKKKVTCNDSGLYVAPEGSVKAEK